MADEALELYKEGMNHFAQDDWAKAIETYQKALEARPNWTDCMLALAEAYNRAERYDEAIAQGLAIVELEPNNAFAHTSLSVFYMRKNMIPEAEAEAAKARMIAWKEELKTNPDAPPPTPPSGMNVVQ